MEIDCKEVAEMAEATNFITPQPPHRLSIPLQNHYQSHQALTLHQDTLRIWLMSSVKVY